MQLRITQTVADELQIERGDGRVLRWNIKEYEKTRFKNVTDPFLEINAFWAFLTEQQQDDIFNVYAEIFSLFNAEQNPEMMQNASDPMMLTLRLIPLVATLFSYHPFDTLSHWVRFRANIVLPTTLKTQYDEKDIIEQTYLRDDYLDLVTMAILLRIMVPIWGEFIYRTKDQVGKRFKELAAMRLLSDAYILTGPTMDRLRLYLKFPIEEEKNNQAALLAGLGSEELPDWLLSVVIVRRVATGEVSASEDRGSIITNIYAFTKGVLKDSDRRFDGIVHDKKPTEDRADPEENISTLEAYKMKQTVPAGDVASYTVYTENYVPMALQIDPTVPVDLVELCVHKAMAIPELEIKQNNLWFCKMVANRAIAARGVDTLQRPALLRLMGVTQAILWHWQLYELSMIVTATAVRSASGAVMSNETRSRIPTDLQKRLCELYPFTENGGYSKGPTKGLNVAVKTIQLVAKDLSANGWLVNAPRELVGSCHFVEHNRMFSPPNTMELLALLIIKIAEEQIVHVQQPI